MFIARKFSDFSQAFLYALIFLTRLPVAGLLHRVDKETIERSIYFYPLVGVVIGVLLSVAAYLLVPLGSQLQAAILLGFWVVLTGALHLDGLADCTDAYFAGHKCADPEEQRRRILKVMHDPHCGSIAVSAVVVFLLIKFAAVVTLLERINPALTDAWVYLPLVLSPMLARAAVLFLMSISEYARIEGHVPPSDPQRRWELLPIVAIGAVFGLVAAPLPVAAGIACTLPAVILFWRHLWEKAIGGYTGDCLGGLVEISEIAVLILWIALSNN
ncbi:adenosylcobinamide-GDP ribazoletransferase [Microbulbifer sp. OS29]|uniref:Adenosylcobinamide-GDP ribazoletransferase n=1 Tax=Microbulbifer okhotskensis TaxID=2926617 RepID=A0A9X2EUK6_9GAMM|nr:adenosylcobinamide-GDP ribazoletransferase [Microbulbifer okhotskensis]MCO1336158.1 adenosylcobinamide-GDP ribazoletransferase [Microbulbifer okhotskensis]